MDTKLVKDKFNYFDENNLILIDGSGYIFRAYYALPPMTNPEGIPINAVYGFMNMIIIKMIFHYQILYNSNNNRLSYC